MNNLSQAHTHANVYNILYYTDEMWIIEPKSAHISIIFKKNCFTFF